MQAMTVEFAASDGSPLKADVFRPSPDKDRRCAVLLIHGGGWHSGDRRDMARYAPALTARGYTAVAMQYRLLADAPWPAQLEDVMAAIDWMIAHAGSLGIRDDRIVLQGFSAGAHLALMAGGKRDDLAAIVAWFPPTRLALPPCAPSQRDATTLLGAAATTEEADAASPLLLARQSFPPTLLLHGASDWAVDPSASIEMYKALTAAGARAELHLFPGQHHEFSSVSTMIEPLQNEVATFIEREVFDGTTHATAARAENPFALGREGFMTHMAALRDS